MSILILSILTNEIVANEIFHSDTDSSCLGEDTPTPSAK